MVSTRTRIARLATAGGRALACAALAATITAATAATATAAATKVPCDPAALQAAIAAANTAGTSVLKLAKGCIYAVTTPSTTADAFPIVTGNVTIVGAKDTIVARDPAASSDFRVFEVASGGTLTLQKLTIQCGQTTALGGAVLNQGTLDVKKVTFSNNGAGNGGAVANQANATATIASSLFFLNVTNGVGGGGVLTSGALTIKKSHFFNNVAAVNGGALNVQPSGTATVVACVLDHNRSGSLGGAIANLGTLTLTGGTITLNKGSSGGAIATTDATKVTIAKTKILTNDPDNCSPSMMIAGCPD
jgi:hypothetical protein